jgi:hypothetical protein
MFREDDNFWKQIVSFKGCGQNDPPPRREWQKILLSIVITLSIGVLIAAGINSPCVVDWSGGA